jgi:CRP/FNR family transcriptional regulator
VPTLAAVPFATTDGTPNRVLLTDRQRQDLVKVGTRVDFAPRSMVYREGSPAQCVFAITDGAVKSYRDLPSGKRTVTAFLFAGDLFGLAENGRYVNSVRAITRVTLYQLPLEDLADLLKHDGELQFKFLVKVTHELREAQRRAVIINRRDAAGRLAMFIALMRFRNPPLGNIGDLIPLPMTRSDIGGFLGLSLESVSRAAAELTRRGLVTFDRRNHARVVDKAGFHKLLAAH